MKPRRVALLTILAITFAVGDARAAEQTLRVSGTSAEPCHERWRGGETGVATGAAKVAGLGVIDATLSAPGGDWDLALFDASGRSIGAAASPGAREVVNGFLVEGDTVRIQACRRSGDAESATVDIERTAFPKDEPGKIMIVDVKTPTRAHKDKLVEMGFDLTEHGHEGALGVVLHGDKDEQRLRRAGFEYTVEIDDLAARSRRDAAADRRFAQATTRSDLPSGRDEYRVLADYEEEMKALAAANPGLVRLFELPHRTWQGRAVMGIEITTDVNVNDGKPGFLNMGLHHAREWPSGEHAMEWAYELINGFKSGDARVTRIVRGSRNFIVPVVNPDGFNASRTAGALTGGDGGRPEDVPDTVLIVGGTANGGEYRRKNCRLADGSEAGNCLTSAGLAENGVDPNRNYGGLWGGPGADQTNPLSQTYPGPGPFSEPETRNIKALVGGTQITTLITNHTTAGLVLRAPGLAMLGDPVDEERGYKALGDDMALQNGYFSQKSYELYDTTGTTEDWTYNTAGGYGFTFEIYCGDPNYSTGDCDDPAFHPMFATMVKEWDGTSPQADHENDPGRSEENPFGNVAGFDGKGNREAYYLAAESTLNEQRHSIIEGEAPAGATLRLRKTFKTETFPQAPDDKPILFDDGLESSIQVGPDGRYRWHTNPSTRPIVAKERGDRTGGEPAPAEQQSGTPVPPGNNDPAPYYTDEAPGAAPGGDANTTNPAFYNDHQIVVPATGDNRSANIRVSWPSPVSDWDIKLFEDTNGDGRSAGETRELGSSAQGATTEEEVGLVGAPKLTPGKKYVLRVVNFASGEPYEVDIRWNGPEPYRPAEVEAYTMTCEVGGQVLQTTNVTVDRGQTARPNLEECLARSSSTASPSPPSPPSPATPGGASSAQEKSCVAGGGFRSAGARGSGGRVALSFSRKIRRPVTVDVFQQSIGRLVIGERLVARFSNRASGFTWNGRANRRDRRVTDGYYFLRYRMTGVPGGTDYRRVTLRRVNGRWTTRPAFYRPDSCGVVRSYKLTRPVFGGRRNRELGISFRLLRAGRVRLDVLSGSRVVRSIGASNRRAGITHRLRVTSKRLARGDHKFRLTVVEGGRTTRVTLTARRL